MMQSYCFDHRLFVISTITQQVISGLLCSAGMGPKALCFRIVCPSVCAYAHFVSGWSVEAFFDQLAVFWLKI